jgi:hypothetical protein
LSIIALKAAATASLARAMSRYVPRSALFYQGNRNERADYLDLAR